MTRPPEMKLLDLAMWIYFFIGFLYGILFSVVGVVFGAEPLIVGLTLTLFTGLMLLWLILKARKLKEQLAGVGP